MQPLAIVDLDVVEDGGPRLLAALEGVVMDELVLEGAEERIEPRPSVYVLTDGSGRDRQSRLASTSALLDDARACRGAVYGRFRDAEIYQVILNGREDWFFALAEELARDFRSRAITHPVSDAPEGDNPSHDLCRVLADVVSDLASQTGVALRRCDFPLVGAPNCSQLAPDPVASLSLTEAEFRRKPAAARAYAELKTEAELALDCSGVESFRCEAVPEVFGFVELSRAYAVPPFYEQYGEQQVAAGQYQTVLRFRQHVLPLVRGLAQRAGVPRSDTPQPSLPRPQFAGQE